MSCRRLWRILLHLHCKVALFSSTRAFHQTLSLNSSAPVFVGDLSLQLNYLRPSCFKAILKFIIFTSMAATDSHSNNLESSYQDKKSNSPPTAITPKPAYLLDGSGMHRKIQVTSSWTTLDEQPLTGESIAELFSNAIPVVRYPKLLSTEECARLVDIINTVQVVSSSTCLWTHELLSRSHFEPVQEL